MFLNLDRTVIDGFEEIYVVLAYFFQGQSWDNIKNGPILGWYDFRGEGASVLLLTDNKFPY